MESTDKLRGPWPTFAAATVLGAVYALGMRLFFSGDIRGFELLTRCFYIGVPIATGVLTTWLALRNNQGIRVGIASTGLAVLVFVATCILIGLEGIICIVLLLPVLVTVPFFGTALAYTGWRILERRGRSTLPALALLPLLLAPLEQSFPVDAAAYTITDAMVIRAPPARVWAELTNVRNIRSDELKSAFIFTMGVPRPLDATMDGEGVGSVRTSRWEKNVTFRERMTQWIPGKQMAYDFVIDPETIPASAFDEHVRIGGKNYEIQHGGYRLEEISPGITRLALSTTIANHSRTGWYGRAWSQFAFADFHNVILDLVRDRSEAQPSFSKR